MGTGLPHPLKKDGRAERPIARSNRVTRTCKCGIEITRKALSCRSCRVRPTVIEWPGREVVEQMVRETSYSATGRRLGVSDNAVRKYLARERIGLIL